MLTATARAATTADIAILEALYAELETEMVALKPIWRLTDGLPEPVSDAFASAIEGEGAEVIVGEIEGVPVGVLLWRDVDLLPQARGERAGVIELIFTSSTARRVGVGEAMISRFLAAAESRGIQLFDAVVPPGHRDAKNFFESNGFKARRIVMHRHNG